MDRFTLKSNARSQLRGNIGVLFVCTLIVGLITAVCAALSYGIASLLVVPPFELGMDGNDLSRIDRGQRG